MEIKKTTEYETWFNGLTDKQVQTRIQVRIRRLILGNAGDTAAVGDGVSEMRLHFGAGWRVYYVQHGTTVTVLLAGGNKKTQQKDIELALMLARNI